ncbi:tRNA lysidine(34) synthetase TilS [Sphingomicrobium sediminis]|uniref:tRNA(Ile)-lysidine synthase n=1 Tax=Sphingomicrobium sediminis TaxID=2950949 RepID=A0A9X2EHJ9_9SPHN|nr:tRNA lysidine(34) synthetase TilS [Sphingomicrobium sediminis]MCM8557690.1 tRNA lysidine(34) synthetase TilS [Sphingomicrobium sediminis]
MQLDDAVVERFRRILGTLVGPRQKIGLAVSGGPDSIALLLLARVVAPSRIWVATVDHKLRPEAADEARFVANLCAKLGVPHETLEIAWGQKPTSNLQARAREQRLGYLIRWAETNGLPVIAMAHHADDQVETLLMRLARGAGLPGLAGIRRNRRLTDNVRLVRPLLGWRRSELKDIVAKAGIEPVDDPSNRDPQHDRTKIREAIEASGLGDFDAIARSAGHLADAEEAVEWMAEGLADIRLERVENGLLLDPEGLPFEVRRRLILRTFDRFGRPRPRGPATVRLIRALNAGEIATLGGLRFAPGDRWSITRPKPHAGTEESVETATGTTSAVDVN